MKKGRDNILASLTLITALTILLALAIINPFQNDKVVNDLNLNVSKTICIEEASSMSSIAERTMSNTESVLLEPVAVHIQTESTPLKSVLPQTKMQQTEVEAKQEPPTYTEDDLFCLAAVIYQEAGAYGISDETRMLVGNVVLNRVESELYPDTIREVLEQYGQWGTMWSDGVKFPADAREEYAQEAVENAYDCARRLLEGERVCPSNVLFAAEFKQGGGVYTVSDGIFFCWGR